MGPGGAELESTEFALVGRAPVSGLRLEIGMPPDWPPAEPGRPSKGATFVPIVAHVGTAFIMMSCKRVAAADQTTARRKSDCHKKAAARRFFVCTRYY